MKNSEEIFEYVQQKGLNPKFVEGGDEIQATCYICGKKEHLYITVVKKIRENRASLPGHHYCMRCKHKGNIRTMQAHFGDVLSLSSMGSAPVKDDDAYRKRFMEGLENREWLPKTRPPDGLDDEHHENLKAVYEGRSDDKYATYCLSWLMDTRMIPWDVLERFKIGYHWKESKKYPGKFSPFWSFPSYTPNGTLINIKYGMFCQEEIFPNTKKKIFLKVDDCISLPLGLNHLSDRADTITIVEGEMDILSLYAYGYQNILSLPDGGHAWKKEWNKYLGSADVIFMGLDNDEVGQKAAYDSAAVIGKMRCFNVLWPDPCVDANDCLQDGIDREIVDKCFLEAHQFPGEKVVDAASLRDEVIHRLFHEDPQKEIGIPTGYKNIDAIIGGIRMKEVSVLTADTGMGKSTFLLTIARHIAHQGYGVFYCPFEMGPSELMMNMMRMELGKRFEDMVQGEVEEIFDHYQSKYPLFFLDVHGKIKVDALLEAIRHCAVHLNISLFIIDPLQYAISPETNKNERELIATFMEAMQKLAKSLHIHIFLVVHPTKLEGFQKVTRKVEMDNLPGTARIKQDSDNVYRLWAVPDENGKITENVEIGILKCRSTRGKTGTAFFLFDDVKLSYIEQNQPSRDFTQEFMKRRKKY